MASRKSKRITKKRNNKIQRRNKIKNKKTKNKKKNINRKYRKTRIMRGGMDGGEQMVDAEVALAAEIIGTLLPLQPGDRTRIYMDISGSEERVIMYDSFSEFKQQLQGVGLLTLAAGEDIIFREKSEDGNMVGDVVRYEDLNTPHNLLKTWNVCKTGPHEKEKKSNGRGGVTNTDPVDTGGGAGDSDGGGFGSFLKNIFSGGATAASNADPMAVEE